MSLLTMLLMLYCSLAPSGGHRYHHWLALVSLCFGLFDWDRFEGWIRIECPWLAADWLTIFRDDLVELNIPLVVNEFDLGFYQFFEYVQGPHVDFYHIFGEILYHKSHIWMVVLRSEQPRGFSNERGNFEILKIKFLVGKLHRNWKVTIDTGKSQLENSIEVGKSQSNFPTAAKLSNYKANFPTWVSIFNFGLSGFSIIPTINSY